MCRVHSVQLHRQQTKWIQSTDRLASNSLHLLPTKSCPPLVKRDKTTLAVLLVQKSEIGSRAWLPCNTLTMDWTGTDQAWKTRKETDKPNKLDGASSSWRHTDGGYNLSPGTNPQGGKKVYREPLCPPCMYLLHLEER